MFPGYCSFVIDKKKCLLPPEFIMEINDGENNKFMVGLTCSDHKQKLEEKFLLLQRDNQIPQGKIIFTPIKVIQTKCVTGNQEDVDEIQLKRL
ncbi:MAG: hypothetical protein H0X50_01735 [Nitrosopumilus sp.]|nr:hypothetical protein [Nitrosopumilus sp.]